jgi:hypothetical protein
MPRHILLLPRDLHTPDAPVTTHIRKGDEGSNETGRDDESDQNEKDNSEYFHEISHPPEFEVSTGIGDDGPNDATDGSDGGDEKH